MKPGRQMKRFEDNVILSDSNVRALKSAVIVGENGGGKSNFIESIKFFQFLFNSSKSVRTIKSLLHYDQCNDDNTQEFEISVCVGGIIYEYALTLDGMGIQEESLKITGLDKKQEKIFHLKREQSHKRDNQHIEQGFNLGINEEFVDENIIKKLVDAESLRGLVVTKLEILEVDIVKKFCGWIKNKLIIQSPSDVSYAVFLEMQQEEENLEILKKDTFMEIFRLVDPSIIGIEIDEEKPFLDSIIVREGENDKQYRTKLNAESSGVREFLAWSLDIWRVIYDNCTLFADEMDKVLNPLLSEKIVTFIHGSEHKGQFIFSTHNVLHMNTINFMKQQLWIITKDKFDMSSKLYSLAEYKDFRYDRTNIYELYLKGLLGGTIDG